MSAAPTGDRRVGIHSLDHFALEVPDLDAATHFFTHFGLDVARHDDCLRLRTFGNPHVWAEIVEGPAKRLRSIRLGAYERDLPALSSRVADARIEGSEPGSNALWCRSPDGLPIEIAVAAKSSPEEKSVFAQPGRHAEHRGAGPRSSVGPVRPRRLAHIALFTADVQASLDFYGRLGIRLSDRSGDDVAFVHGPHGSDHHLLALARSDGPGLHHSSWDVGAVTDVGQGAAQMEAAGYNRGWGLGRHVLGSNYFHYVRDPWGSYAEYSADMDFIPAGHDWPGADHPGEDSFYQWGPRPPEDFGTNYETARG